ncbi:MAG: class I SAM-dependent methyltransferase [Bacillota bacterium]
MTSKTDPFNKFPDKYDKWFERNESIYKTELKAIRHFIPEKRKGMEIGVGSGKFAVPLGIKIGVEPSKEMRKLAKRRGIKVYNGKGEDLSFEDEEFDYVLMVTTICFLDNINRSFKEVKRVLKENSSFIIGFIDKKSPLGKVYLAKKDENIFYKDAEFHSAEEVLSLLEKNGFKNIEVVQTVFGNLEDINSIQNYKEGYGKGGFVVIKAEK